MCIQNGQICDQNQGSINSVWLLYKKIKRNKRTLEALEHSPEFWALEALLLSIVESFE